MRPVHAARPVQTDPSPARVGGLDGIRGLAALYVVLNHVFLRAFPGYPHDTAPWWAGWLIYGRFAVVVFIVLSGFSLALQPARHDWRLDGLIRYARRRARRILPAYWGALALSLAVAWLVLPPPGQPVPTPRTVVTNAVLVQDLVLAPSPNRAFWSIAVEAQLYLVLPLLLLLVRRRGPVTMVIGVTSAVVALGLIAPHLSRLQQALVQAPPDLAALFALGVASVALTRPGSATRSWPWPWLALAAAAAFLAGIWLLGSVRTLDHLIWVDLALGPAVACLLVGLATGAPARLLRLLETRPVVALGSFSYSLYLVHAPVVVVVHERLVAGRVGPGVPDFLVTAAVAVPLAVLLARSFAGVFERPWLRQVSASVPRPEGATSLSAASSMPPSRPGSPAAARTR